MLTRFFLVLSLAGTLAFTDAFAQTTIESSEQSNTGGAAQAGAFSLTASIGGQPSPFGETSGGQFALSSGYIFTLIDRIVCQPPTISHTPVSERTVNQSIDIEAAVSGEDSVYLKYKRSGDSDFQEKKMTLSGGVFRETIPADFVTDRGVEYYIQIKGQCGNQHPPSGTHSIRVILSGTGIQKSTPQPNGSAKTAYRMISMPLDLDDESIHAVLEDDLADYDSTKWRLVDWQNGRWVSPPNRSFTPGRAFFLIVKDPGKQIDSGPGKSNITNQEFSIPLVGGWNMVGNPFNFPIPLYKLRLSSGRSLTLWTYDGGWRTLSQSEQIQPFEGYAIESLTSDALIINPDLSSSSSEVAKQSTSVNESFLWSINILAQCQEARDTYNFAAVADNADLNWDELDQAEPPPIGEYVMVSFPHRDWQTVTSQYSTDARPEPVDGDVWEFEVRSNIRDVISLSFAGLEQIPQAFEVWLVDEALRMTQNLRNNSHYSFVSLQNEQAKRLKLVVGKSGFIDERIEPFNVVPSSFELSQNFPNPFNPGTTIRYGVPAAGRVTIKVFNILGEEVVTLVDEEKPVGYHFVIWDGRDRNGISVAGGVYVYQVRTKNETFTKKMILLR